MSARRIGLALLGALLAQTGLGLLAPDASLSVDLMLVVVVYAALTRGERAGLLTGATAGWLADVAFGGPILGLTALARLIVGWATGAAASRLMLVGVPAMLLVLVTATLADARLLEWLAAAFGIDVLPPTPGRLVVRAASNAALGVLLYTWLDRRLRSEERA